jgi:hypothetical protein
MKPQKKHTYTNLLFASIGIVFAILLSRYESFQTFLFSLGDLGYIGAFIAGILFVSTFTAATGILILLVLAEKLVPLEIGLFAGLGAVVGDVTIFQFIKDGLLDEVEDIYHRLGGRKLSHILHVKAFRWTLPVLGALIIASPLPDELGIGLMGISKIGTLRFIILSFILNSIGIFLVVSASTFIKP